MARFSQGVFDGDVGCGVDEVFAVACFGGFGGAGVVLEAGEDAFECDA